ncbi:hypothetical protein [Photorhabdus sp. SF281]
MNKAGDGSIFLSFLPAMNGQAARAICRECKGMVPLRHTITPHQK